MAKAKSLWDTRIERAEKFFSTAREHGQRVYARYADERSSENFSGVYGARANLFYSNVNTIKESLFNSMPEVDVSRLHKGDFDDDISRVAALILQRAITYEVKCSDVFKESVKSAILDRLVAGIGVSWVTFSADVTEAKDTEGDEVTDAPIVDPQSAKVGMETVYWEDFIYEPARTWSGVSWAGRRLLLTREQIATRWGEGAVDELSMVKERESRNSPKQLIDNKLSVYEIWDKVSRKIYFIGKGAHEPLSVEDDPYGLVGFFPFPEPLIASPTTVAYLPITDYHVAQDQYIELDNLYARMTALTKAMKVSGVYASDAPEIAKMLTNQENQLIPVDNWAMFAEKGGMKGMIDWFPLEQVANVLSQIQQQYEFTKALLFEITGMSDIMRGASNQYETAEAQQIKAQFASVRMNGYQRDVANFVSDILGIIAQMVVKLYDPQRLGAIVGQLNEADQQFMQQAYELLQNDFLRMCRVSVKTDSLVQADWALEKSQRMELMGYMAQFLPSAMQLMDAKPEMGEMMLSLLKWGVTGYRGSQEVEGVIDSRITAMQQAMQQAAQQPPQPPPPTPEEIKAQSDQQYMQMQMQVMQQKAAGEQQLKMLEGQIKQQEAAMNMEIEQQRAQMQAALAQQDQHHKEQMFQLQQQMLEQKMLFDAQMQEQKLYAAQQKAEMDYEMSTRKSVMNLAVEKEKHDQCLAQKSQDHLQSLLHNASTPKEGE